ncbi:MAG: sulfatase [Acidobacteria bacterium]|nr:sulfatase [Acidobacteriota bacterium]
MRRREFLMSLAAPAVAQPKRAPNVVFIYADDLGYGDLGCYGNPSIRTPNLDRLAAEGSRFTQFYSAAPLCSPSRAALLTGRYPVRSGINFVLFPDSTGGLPDSELTIAELLRGRGYATQIVGKWHLGHRPQYLPTRHGFDFYFGIPYSNDMSLKTNTVYDEINRDAGRPPRPPSVYDRYRTLPGIPLMRDEKVIETEPDQTQLTPRYTAEASAFIRKSAASARPFFLYFAHTFPHVPLFASEKFRGRSRRGLYGDAVEELDWSVGEVLRTLAELKLDENTLVLFSSDNGGAAGLGRHGGSNGALREGKSTTWEGGVREPFLARWKGRIAPGQVRQDVASTLDVFPTLARLAGGAPPSNVVLDGADLAPLLWEGQGRPQPDFFYYHNGELRALRRGPWKLHFTGGPKQPPKTELYQVETDIAERFNLAERHPDIVARMQEAIARHQASFEKAPTQR